MTPEEVEIERRSQAMLPPDGPSYLTAGKAFAILDQLGRALRDLVGRPGRKGQADQDRDRGRAAG